MLDNGARWDSETPQSKAKANLARENLVRNTKSRNVELNNECPKHSHFTTNSKVSSFGTTELTQRQNQWLVSSLCCM